MRIDGMTNWIGRNGSARGPGLPIPPGLDIDIGMPGFETGMEPGRPASRADILDFLWGDGYAAPGGEPAMVRLSRALDVSPDTSVLLVGAGIGGPALDLARTQGVTVTAQDSDAAAAATMLDRFAEAGFARRISAGVWSPDAPGLAGQGWHHAIGIDALRDAAPEPVLVALCQAIKSKGHLILTETVADVPLDRGDPTVDDWLRLDGRRRPPPTDRAIARALGRLGFDIRDTEDMSDAQIALARRGWKRAVKLLTSERPGPEASSLLIAEAEAWTLRAQLIAQGTIRQMRWHAVRRTEVV